MRTRGGMKEEYMWARYKKVWMECERYGMFVCAKVRWDLDAVSAGAYLYDICLTRMAKVETGKTNSGNRVEIESIFGYKGVSER